jgi:glutaredoxin 3
MQPKVTIYSKDYCPYCDRAKEFFESRSIPFEEINVSTEPATLAELKAKTHHMTVPQIFIDGVFVGGYTDLVDKFRRGEVSLTH